MRKIAFLALFLILVCSNLEAGQQFRSFEPIPTPAANESKEENLTMEGFQLLSEVQAVPVDVVEKATREIFGSWNSTGLGPKLSKDFPNRTRILDAIQSDVPRHVKLQILSIQNPHVVKQYVRQHPCGDGSWQVLSKISVRVTSQVAASTSLSRKFQRVDGTSEYLISITQKVRPT